MGNISSTAILIIISNFCLEQTASWKTNKISDWRAINLPPSMAIQSGALSNEIYDHVYTHMPDGTNKFRYKILIDELYAI